MTESELSRYDLVLAAIPAAFLVGLAAAGLLDVGLRTGLAVAAALSVPAVVDALFVSSPDRVA